MTLYSLVLFVHVIAAIGLFIALALEGFVSLRIAWSEDADEMRFFVRAFERLKWIGIPAFAGILLGGLYLAYPYGASAFWIPAALIATLAIMAIGGFVTGRKRIRLSKDLARPGVEFAALAERASAGSLAVSYGLRVGLALAIVFLMTTQPALWPSIAVLGVGVAGGFLTASVFKKISKRGSTGCGPVWRRPLDQSPEPSAR